MQFQNTSDTATRTETDEQDCSGELHAKLLEETETGELHDMRARHDDTPSEGFVSCKTPQRRPARRPPIGLQHPPAITTTRQNSHVIRLREHSTTSRNVAIPTTTIQCLKQSRGNYVRNWWHWETDPQHGFSRSANSSRHSATQAPRHTPHDGPVTQNPTARTQRHRRRSHRQHVTLFTHSSHESLQMQIRRGADLAIGPSAYPINTVQVVPVSSSKLLSSALPEPAWPVPYSLVMTPTVGGQPCGNGKGS